jgi:hypothetical protein
MVGVACRTLVAARRFDSVSKSDPRSANRLRAAVMRARLSPIKVLQARAEARLLLHEAGQFDLEAAIEPLYLFAIEHGIAMSLAREIIAGAFGSVAFGGWGEIELEEPKS